MFKKKKRGVSVLVFFVVLMVFILPLGAAGKAEQKSDEMVITSWHH